MEACTLRRGGRRKLKLTRSEWSILALHHLVLRLRSLSRWRVALPRCSMKSTQCEGSCSEVFFDIRQRMALILDKGKQWLHHFPLLPIEK